MADTDYKTGSWDTELTLARFERLKEKYPEMTDQWRVETFLCPNEIRTLVENGIITPDYLLIVDTESALIDGTLEQLESLIKGVSYEYDAEKHILQFKFGEMSRRVLCENVPSCVRYYGDTNTF